MADASDKLGWRPGYTHGTSEGKWSRVESGLMKFERAGTLTYGPPASQAWAEGHERIFGAKPEQFCAAGHRLAWCDCEAKP
jgi:hypothetical protein